jgi:chromatin remodeling complex protein RSC6
MATPSKTTTTRKPNAAFMKPLTPSPELAAVIGRDAMPRTEVTKKIWEYIKKHHLQDASNKRNINADAKLRPIFGKDQVTMFELTKLVSVHLK